MNKKEKQKAIESVLTISVIGFTLGGFTSIVSGTPFFITTSVFAGLCGSLSFVQTGLFDELKEKKSRKNLQKSSNDEEINYDEILENEPIKKVINVRKNTMSQEKIDEIHSRGKLIPDEKVKEWEAFDLCVPGDHIGSASNRCRTFKNCHECLTDYAYSKEEYDPINFKLTNPMSNYSTNNEEENDDKDVYIKKLKM